ncbi:MAG: DUF3267 domain-containing protein [Candidatus Cloacimonadales bacterium]
MPENYTMSAWKVNLWAIPLTILQVVLWALPLLLILGRESWLQALGSNYLQIPYFLLILILGSVLHEFLHALGFLLLGRIKLSDLKLGIIWRYLTPYAHCKIAVSARVYRFALLLPYLLLGILPVMLSYLFSLVWLNIYGTIFCLLAGGDLLVFWLIRRVQSEEKLLDHPNLCGCQKV